MGHHRGAPHRARAWAHDRENAPAGDHAMAPSAARMYDYYLGGKDNYAVDRDLADRVLRRAPVVSRLVRANRAFLAHAARDLAERAGIRQFLDIGCGLPAHINVDDVVRRIDPACRVAYVDNDPLVVSHARALLAVDGGTMAFQADLREPAGVLGRPELRRLIDFDEPVAVLLLSVLHFVTDAENPKGIIDELMGGLAPGSHLVVSHAERTPDLDAVSELYRLADVPFTPRDRERITELSAGLDPLPSYPSELAAPRAGRHLRTTGAIPLIGCIARKPG